MAKKPELIPHRDDPGNELAVMFVHGFGGHPAKTWGRFPDLLESSPELQRWNIFSFGYPTGFAFDLTGIWKADPPLDSLADELRTRAMIAPLDRYRGLALVAHSMGGLIVQRALVDSKEFADRVTHAVFFGTPSGGLVKALLARFWKRQFDHMSRGGAFVTDLRERWGRAYGDGTPFQFAVVGGSQDEFVPRESSVEPFPERDRFVVRGDHLSIVKPTAATDLSVEIVRSTLTRDATAVGPIEPAAYVLERQQARATVDRLRGTPDLDERGLVKLALALEYLGETDEAIELLERGIREEYTDAKGVLAGRLKRRWKLHASAADANRAMMLYSEAYERSQARGDCDQAHYHGINVAFMQIAYRNDRAAAQRMARDVLTHCAGTIREKRWALASEAEARLYLGENDAALETYREALETAAGIADDVQRQNMSMYQQATRVAAELGDRDLAARLEELFRGD